MADDRQDPKHATSGGSESTFERSANKGTKGRYTGKHRATPRGAKTQDQGK